MSGSASMRPISSHMTTPGTRDQKGNIVSVRVRAPEVTEAMKKKAIGQEKEERYAKGGIKRKLLNRIKVWTETTR